MDAKELHEELTSTDWDRLGSFLLFDVPVLFPEISRLLPAEGW